MKFRKLKYKITIVNFLYLPQTNEICEICNEYFKIKFMNLLINDTDFLFNNKF